VKDKIFSVVITNTCKNITLLLIKKSSLCVMEKWKQVDISTNFLCENPTTSLYKSLYDIESGKYVGSQDILGDTQELKVNDLSLQHIDIQCELKHLRSSPIILESVYGSGSNSDADIDVEEEIHNEKQGYYIDGSDRTYNDDTKPMVPYNTPFRKLKFQDVEKSVSYYYDSSQETPYSNELDILITFIKGQTQLYLEAKMITQHKLHCLMFPTLLISALLTITSPYLSCNKWNLEITSGMNAIVTFLLSMIHYLKLESTMESYSQMANHLDTIYTSLEMTSSKITFLKDEKKINKLIVDKFNEVEEKIKEHRLHCSLLLPEHIKYLFPVISHVNVFQVIKRYKHYRRSLIEKLRNVKNEKQYILFQWDKREHLQIPRGTLQEHQYNQEQTRLHELNTMKDSIKSELIEYKNMYSILDDLFSREVKDAEVKKKKWIYYSPICCYHPSSLSLTKGYINELHPSISHQFSFLFYEGT